MSTPTEQPVSADHEKVAEGIARDFSYTFLGQDDQEALADRIAAALTTQCQRGVDAGREEAAGIAESISGEVSHRQIEIAHAIAAKIRSRIGKGVEDGTTTTTNNA
jgi:hypothetical protein